MINKNKNKNKKFLSNVVKEIELIYFVSIKNVVQIYHIFVKMTTVNAIMFMKNAMNLIKSAIYLNQSKLNKWNLKQ